MTTKLKVSFKYNSGILLAEHQDSKLFVEIKVDNSTETLDEAKLRALKLLSEKLKEIPKILDDKKPKSVKKTKKKK